VKKRVDKVRAISLNLIMDNQKPNSSPKREKKEFKIFPIISEIWSQLDKTEKKYLKFGLWFITILGAISTIAIPLLLTKLSWVDYTSTGQIGDTIGGISAPFIGILAAILTFLAFYVQYKANNLQREQFNQELKKQEVDDAERERSWKIERFENKFYELLRLHKSNVNEIQIKNRDRTQITSGRNSFVSMFYEFKYTFFCCQYRQNELYAKDEIGVLYTPEQLIRLAYIFFYCGVEDKSDVVSVAMNQNPRLSFNTRLFGDVLWYLSSVKQGALNSRTFYDDDQAIVTDNKIEYRLWEGHQSNLGHYYRHLFQTVKFVAKQDEQVITKEQKKDYLRSLRAQLSDFEQIMLYYNALALFGDDWISEGFFTEYRMIHNLPLPLANFGMRPQNKFAEEMMRYPNFFEWE